MEENKTAEQTSHQNPSATTEESAEDLDLFASSTTGELDEGGLDLFLQKNDSQFVESLKVIEQDKELVALDITFSDKEQELAEEINYWESSTGIRKVLFKVIPFLPRISLAVKRAKFKFFLYLRGLWVRLKNFAYFLATDGRQSVVKKIKVAKDVVSHKFGELSAYIGKLSKWQKLGLVGIFALAGFTAVFSFKAATTGVIKDGQAIFIPSLGVVAEAEYDFDPDEEVEPFYENLRSTQNIFLMPKMVVNLKRPPPSNLNPNPNPMGAFEFFIEGMVPEVIVELKDREAEFKDAVQRIIEEFSFDELELPAGKAEMSERIRKTINKMLTKGTVKKVLIKNVVLKP